MPTQIQRNHKNSNRSRNTRKYERYIADQVCRFPKQFIEPLNHLAVLLDAGKIIQFEVEGALIVYSETGVSHQTPPTSPNHSPVPETVTPLALHPKPLLLTPTISVQTGQHPLLDEYPEIADEPELPPVPSAEPEIGSDLEPNSLPPAPTQLPVQRSLNSAEPETGSDLEPNSLPPAPTQLPVQRSLNPSLEAFLSTVFKQWRRCVLDTGHSHLWGTAISLEQIFGSTTDNWRHSLDQLMSIHPPIPLPGRCYLKLLYQPGLTSIHYKYQTFNALTFQVESGSSTQLQFRTYHPTPSYLSVIVCFISLVLGLVVLGGVSWRYLSQAHLIPPDTSPYHDTPNTIEHLW